MNRLFTLFAIICPLLSLAACTNMKSQFDNTEKPDAIGPVLRITDMYYQAYDRYGEINKGKMVNGTAEEYDCDGRKTTVTTYNEKGKPDWVKTYSYDKKGCMIQMTMHDTGKEIETYSVEETNNKRIIKEPEKTITQILEGNTISEFENDILTTTNSYDDKGRSLVFKDVTDDSQVEYRYGEKGQTAYIIIDEDGTLDFDCHLVEFDSRGNWTKMYMSHKGEIAFLRERSITYWE